MGIAAISTRRLCLILATVLLAGCSAIRLGYGQGEGVLFWWIDHYVDMDTSQEAWVREELSAFFVWHRQTQLPDYAVFLRSLRKTVQEGPSRAEDARHMGDELARFTRILAARAIPATADILLSLRPEQVQRMEEKFTQANRSFRREHVDIPIAEQRQARFERVIDRAAFWYGRFSAGQEGEIRQAVDALPLNNQYWYQERLRRQREWLDIVRVAQHEKQAKAKIEQLLRDYVERFDRSPDEQRRAYFGALRDASAALGARIMNLASMEQRTHAIRRLESWAKDFEVLARGG